MTPLANVNVTLVREGDIVRVPTGFPSDTVEHVVQRGCTDPQFRTEGQWICVTHQLVHANNLAASSHEHEGFHVIAWGCFKHGIEVPET